MDERNRLLKVEELAELLQLSPWTIRHMVSDGRLKPVRIGRLVRFRIQDAERLMKHGLQATAQEP